MAVDAEFKNSLHRLINFYLGISALNELVCKLKCGIARAISFLWGSLAGVTVDLCMFQVAILAGLPPMYANMMSSGMAIATTYFFVSRYTFNEGLNTTRFFWFFAYYSISIAAFSLAIAYAIEFTQWSALFCKMLTLPVSFAVNFIFSSIILGRK